MSELPAGWIDTQLRHLLKLKYGKALPDRARSGTGYPVFGSNGQVGLHEIPLTGGETIVVGRKGSVGEVHFSERPCSPIDTTYYVDEFAGLPPRYWMYQLRNLHLRDLNKSTAIPGLNREDAYRLPINLPPAAEQRRIADKLDTLLSTVDACRARLDRVPQILKKFREAVLEAAVSGRLTEEWRAESSPTVTGVELARRASEAHRAATEPSTENLRGARKRHSATNKSPATVVPIRSSVAHPDLPDSWGLSIAAEVVEPEKAIIYGILQPGPDVPNGIPYVQGVDIDRGAIQIDQLARTTPAIAAQYARSTLASGDVVLCIIRNIKVALVPPALDRGNISRTIARLRPSVVIRGKYLATVLDSPISRQWFKQFFRGIDMPGLNLRDVRQLPVPLPSIEEQDEINRRVDELFALADSLERRYDGALSRVSNLTPSVLAKAFRGKLVPQDPNDEPAGEMLERIQSACRKGKRSGTAGGQPASPGDNSAIFRSARKK